MVHDDTKYWYDDLPFTVAVQATIIINNHIQTLSPTQTLLKHFTLVADDMIHRRETTIRTFSAITTIHYNSYPGSNVIFCFCIFSVFRLD